MKEPLTYLRNLLRGNERQRADEPHQEHGHDNPPVLVLHGYLGTRGAMYLIERRLQRDGFSAISLPLGLLNTSDIRKSARRVSERVEEILAETGRDRLDIVAHSMGGLISLYYIQKLGGDETVRRLVTLGTPYRGSPWALLGVAFIGLVGLSSWQLVPHNPFLSKLLRRPLPPDVTFYSIRGRHDMLSPMSVSHLPGARDVLVPCSHAGLVTQSVAYRAVLSCLTEPERQRGDDLQFSRAQAVFSAPVRTTT